MWYIDSISLWIGIWLVSLVIGACLGRMYGGGLWELPKLVENALIMSFFVAACIPFAGVWSLLALLGMLGISTGHGQYFLNRQIKHIKAEWFDFIVKLVFGHDSRTLTTNQADIEFLTSIYGMKKLYWRNVFGMFVTGTVVGLPAAIISFVFGYYLVGVLLLTTGIIKASAYMISDKFLKSTEGAEYINGGLRGLVAMVALYLALRKKEDKNGK